jgi:putative transposase
VEDLLPERGIDICHKTGRMWWNPFGPIFARDDRRQRVDRMKFFRHWRWHVDEVNVKINGEMRCIWRAVNQQERGPRELRHSDTLRMEITP